MALFDGDRLVFSAEHDGATEHAEALPTLVKSALAIENQIDEVIIGMGPGPFTGLRVGIAFGQTFAHARSIPWRGVCSLDGIDIDCDEYIVATDARRKEIYWARYKDGMRVDGPHVGVRDELANIELPIFGFSFTSELFPSPHLLLVRSRHAQVSEPLYLRKPDAVPTSERR